LRQFGDFGRIKLEPSPALQTLVQLAVDAEEGTKHSSFSKTEIVDVCVPPSHHVIGIATLFHLDHL
jgi:DNA mismatch repair protein MLH1